MAGLFNGHAIPSVLSDRNGDSLARQSGLTTSDHQDLSESSLVAGLHRLRNGGPCRDAKRSWHPPTGIQVNSPVTVPVMFWFRLL